MKKFLIVLLLIFCFPVSVEAHTLKTVGSVGAVIHVDPDDEPSAAIPSAIFLEFHDRDGKFSLDKCNCTIKILSNGEELYAQNFQNLTLDATSIGTSFIFPKAGVYQVEVGAKAQKNGEFKPFQLVFDVRVLPANSNPTNTDNSRYIIPGILALAGIFLLVYYWQYRR